MLTIINKSLVYIFIILIAYFLRAKHILQENACKTLSTLMLDVTLPCVIICNMNGVYITNIYIIYFGILFNIVCIVVGFLLSKKRNFTILNISGYNIGCFALPFISNFLDKNSILMTSLFDIGNSIMCLGVTFQLTKIMKTKQRINASYIVKSILSSIPVITYLIMIILSLFKVYLPNSIIDIVNKPAEANTFLAMATIGSSINFKFNKDRICIISQNIMLRILTCIILVFLTLLLPVDVSIKKVLTILIFAPISAASVAYTEKLGEDYETSAILNSVYIFISLIMMSIVIIVQNLY